MLPVSSNMERARDDLAFWLWVLEERRNQLHLVLYDESIDYNDTLLFSGGIDQCLPVLGSDRAHQANMACWELEKSSDVGDIAEGL